MLQLQTLRTYGQTLSVKRRQACFLDQAVGSGKQQSVDQSQDKYANHGMCSELIGEANTSIVLFTPERCEALLDSESMVSTISQSVCEKLGLQVKPLGELIRVEGAGGHNLEYSGYMKFPTLVNMSDNAVLFIIPSRSRDTLYNSNVPMLIEINILKVAAACFEGDFHGDGSDIGKHGKPICIA